MSLLPIIIATSVSIAIGLFANNKWRTWSLLITSILAIYWLQPASPIRHLDFWLPTAGLMCAILTWVFTKQTISIYSTPDLITGAVILGLIIIIGLTRYFGPLCCLTSSRPPEIYRVLMIVFLILFIAFLAVRVARDHSILIYTAIIILIGLFIILKSATLANLLSIAFRSLSSQSIELASPLDIRWLGFSYIAFRLLHTLRDRLSGRLPELSLQEYVIFIIFFPAISAGPIDRVQRFTQDLKKPYRLSMETGLSGLKRIFIGVFNKFVLADGLALIALNNSNSNLVISSGWLWVMLYAFAYRIFFDFSGYTDIAIGMGQLLGIQLPENFQHPYRQPNITQFWNSWHITLAQWFRSYFFNPISRALRSSSLNISLPLIIFTSQLSTFILIGMWHGINMNFAIWGAWHGIGLFVHNRWTALIRPYSTYFENRIVLQRSLSILGIFLTFNYVSLGWVWFVLSTPTQSWQTLLKLFGLV